MQFGTYKPNEERARQAMLLIWIVMAVHVAAVVSAVMQLKLLHDFQNNIEISDEAFEQNDLREQILYFVYLAAFITSAVTFIRWFRRSYYNLRLFTPTQHPDNQALFAWFIPILNLFRPYQIMKELYTETWDLVKGKLRFEGTKLPLSYLYIWWALWIISNIAGQISWRMGKEAGTVEGLINLTYVSLADNLLSIPLAWVTVKVIQYYHAMEVVLPSLHQETDTESVLVDLI